VGGGWKEIVLARKSLKKREKRPNWKETDTKE